MFQAKNCAAQSRLCGAGKAAITETSTLALMVAITLQATPALTAIIGAAMLRRRLLRRYGGWTASLLAAAAYLIAVVAVGLVLPTINEVPDQFPAVVLWQFRIASLGAQLVMWTTIGITFGALTERTTTGEGRLRPKVAAF